MASSSVEFVANRSHFGLDVLHVYNYNSHLVITAMKDLGYLPFYSVFAYVILIFMTREIMKSREALQLQVPLFLWNLVLAIFSIATFLNVFRELRIELLNAEFDSSLCNPALLGENKIIGFWGFAFAMSKFWELGDTAFIVLRKKKLLFLHWYHHATVLLACWYSYISLMGSGTFMLLVNAFIHSCMYSYFAFQAVNIKIPKFISQSLTSLQIIQMAFGAYLALRTYLLSLSEPKCHVSYPVLTALGVMYLSYFVLFVKFFQDAYLSRKVNKVIKES